MGIFEETIERELPDLAAQGVKVRFIGRRDRAPVALQARMVAMEDETEGNDRIDLWVAFDYGGRAELVDAARRLIEAGRRAGGRGRGCLRRRARRTRAARARTCSSDVRRAADLELPPLAARLLGARLRRLPLARLRRRRPARGARGVLPAAGAASAGDEQLLARGSWSRRSASRVVARTAVARRVVAVRARRRRRASSPCTSSTR